MLLNILYLLLGAVIGYAIGRQVSWVRGRKNGKLP